MPTKQPPKRQLRPKQRQNKQPGLESKMRPLPKVEQPATPQGKLAGKVAVISGGDSGIGRAVAVAMAAEGADIAILYLNEHQDAKDTVAMVEEKGRRCLAIAGDLGIEKNCVKAIDKVLKNYERLDIIVNNAAEQHPQESLLDITAEQLDKTFRTNIYSYFFLTKAALPHLKQGASIINTSSVTAYRGSAQLLDYSATKGAIVAFTRSLAMALAKAEDPRQRRRPWSGLDAADPRDVSRGQGRHIWFRCPAGPRGRALGDRAELCVLGERGRLVHDRPVPASKWRRSHQYLVSISVFLQTKTPQHLASRGGYIDRGSTAPRSC